MAISKFPIKLNHIEAVFKVVNDSDAADTITLGLATDFLKSNETLSGETPTVNISSVEAAISDLADVALVRSGKTVMNLFENTNALTLPWGADSENNTADIVVNMSSKGTIIIRFLKIKGYKANFRPEQGVN